MILRTFRSDIEIIKERDPAARGILEIFLCYPGFQSIVIHRFTHKLWQLKIPLIPSFSLSSTIILLTFLSWAKICLAFELFFANKVTGTPNFFEIA